jgi:hypothetical protein
MKINLKRKPRSVINNFNSMITWSRVIETFEALPEIYHPLVHQLQSELGHLPYMVLTPFDNFSSKTPEQVICSVKDRLYILEPHEKKLSVDIFPAGAVRDIEFGAILLYSWMTINGRTLEGDFKTRTITFNSVSYPHFIPFINQARCAPQFPNVGQLEREKSKFDYLTLPAFKFMNYCRKSLMGGEQVLNTIWEPEIREKVFSRLSLPFYHTVSHSHLVILTDRELIVIREEDLTHLIKGNRYGGIWRYIPLRSLRSQKLSESGALLSLDLVLDEGSEIQILYRKQSRLDVESLMAGIESMAGIPQRQVA